MVPWGKTRTSATGGGDSPDPAQSMPWKKINTYLWGFVSKAGQ
jgi:hypothetical protein